MSLSQWLQLIALSVLWGGAFLSIGIAIKEVPPLTLVLARVGLAVLTLLPVLLATGQRLPHTAAGWMPFAVMAVLNNIVPFMLIVIGQMQITSGLASVLNATTPLFAVLVGWAIGGDRPLAASKLAGVLVGLIGVAVLVGPEAALGRASGVLGMLCVLGAAFSYGLSALWGRRFSSTPPLVSSTAQLLCSTVMLLPVVLLVDQPWTLAVPSWPTVNAVVGLAVLSTALAYIFFFNIMAVSGPLNAMLVTMLIPASGIVLGHLVLDEPIVARQIAGALVIAFALLILDGRLLHRIKHAGPRTT